MKYLPKILENDIKSVLYFIKEESKRLLFSDQAPQYKKSELISKNEIYVVPVTINKKKYFKVVSPKMYRVGHFARESTIGIYIPSEADLFIIGADIPTLKDLESDALVTGDNLRFEMDKRGLYSAWYVKEGGDENKKSG